MSIIDYEDLADLATEMLEEFGIKRTLTRTTGATPKRKSTDTAVAGNETIFTPFGCVLEYHDSLIDETRIKHGDRMLYLDASVVPQIDDKVTHESEQWAIVRIKTHNPGGTVLLYVCQIRK